jgi:predicted acylesterase/phospholipase RssA
MVIKHLVISGGGPTMIQIIGAIQQLETDKFLDMSLIETIYGTSAGAIVAILLCLKFDWETINDYIIKRPWQDVFAIKVENIFDAYSKKGIFDLKTIEKCFKPLLNAKEIPLNINLEEFYDFSKIEIHLYSFEINEYKIEDISYLTHPKLSLLTAIQMTCGIPLLVKPVFIDNKCYIDGGISCNYPLNFVIISGKKSDEILGFKNKYRTHNDYINEESTLLDFLLKFLFKAIFSLNTDDKQPFIKNEILCDTDYLNITTLKCALSEIDIRKKLLNDGIDTAIQFLLIDKNKSILIHEEMP